MGSIAERVTRARAAFLADMARIVDAVLAVTGAMRINYEILGNVDPELHAHVFPRFAHEPDERRLKPVWFYDWASAVKYSPREHGPLRDARRHALCAVRSGDWKLLLDGGQPMRFDVHTDLAERNDRIAARPDLARQLEARLVAWEKDVDAEAKGASQPPSETPKR